MAHILITYGPTRPYLDPVRYLTNASSGRMGLALAEATLALGHDATIVTGPVDVSYPPAATVEYVVSTEEMLAAAQRAFTGCDGLIAAGGELLFRADVFEPPLMLRFGARTVPRDERVQPLTIAIQRYPVHAHACDGNSADTGRIVQLGDRLAKKRRGAAPVPDSRQRIEQSFTACRAELGDELRLGIVQVVGKQLLLRNPADVAQGLQVEVEEVTPPCVGSALEARHRRESVGHRAEDQRVRGQVLDHGAEEPDVVRVDQVRTGLRDRLLQSASPGGPVGLELPGAHGGEPGAGGDDGAAA